MSGLPNNGNNFSFNTFKEKDKIDSPIKLTNINIDSLKIDSNDTGLYSSEDDFLILSNLTLLSKIQKYEKLIILKNEDNINAKIDFEIKIDNSYVPSVSRWIYGYGRNATIEFINKLIDIAIQQYLEEKKKNNKINMNKYVSLLESSKLGLSNLKFTYSDDQTITSNIDIIIDKIDIFRINTHCV